MPPTHMRTAKKSAPAKPSRFLPPARSSEVVTEEFSQCVPANTVGWPNLPKRKREVTSSEGPVSHGRCMGLLIAFFFFQEIMLFQAIFT